MKYNTFRRYRLAIYTLLTAVFFGLPFLRVREESAFRFDIPTLKLHVFGTALWMNEFFIVLVAVLFLTLLFLWVTLVFGRIWCGWLCPQMLLVTLTEKRNRAGHLVKRDTASHLKALVLSLLTGAAMVWYFVSPYEFLPRLAALELGKVEGWSWAVLSVITWLNLLLVRESFCATVCPYSKLQGALFDGETLVIAYDPARAGECIECSACVRVCPVRIDIRNGLQAACVSCAECIDACTRALSKKGRASLIGYFFGAPGGSFRPFRPAAALTGTAALLFLALFILLAAQRAPLALTVLPNHGYAPRTTLEGRILTSFTLSLENRSPERMTLAVSAAGPALPLDISPRSVTVGGGEHRKVPAYVVAGRAGRIDIILTRGDGETAESSATVIAPDR